DGRQQVVGFGTLALLLPQTAQACRGSQFQRLRLLLAGNVEGLVKTALSLRVISRGERLQELSFKPVQLRLVESLTAVIRRHQRFGHQAQSLLGLPHMPICLSHQSQIIRPYQLCPCRPPSGQSLVHLTDPFRSLPLCGERPSPQNRALRQKLRKPLLSTETNR